MKNNHYESVVIINAAIEDEQIESTLKRIQETISTNAGEIDDVEKWGRKRLAYPIQKSKSGFYVVVRFTAPTSAIYNLERMYRLDENIIRYLTITLDKKALDYIEKKKQKEQEAATSKEEKVEEKADEKKEEIVEEKKEETTVDTENKEIEEK